MTATSTDTATPPPDTVSEPLDDLADTVDAAADRLVVAAGRHSRGADGLNAVTTLLGAVDRVVAAVITLLQTADHRETIAAHGMTRDAWLRAVAHRTGADAGMLLAAAERLVDMPAVADWFRQGVLTWGVVRGIVGATRCLTAEQRQWVDDRLRADKARVLRLDSDQIVAAVDHLANRARPDLHHDRANRTLRQRWLSIQPALDGTARIHGNLDPETAAAALSAFATTATDDREDAGDDASSSHAEAGARPQANVDIFMALCEQRLTRRSSTDPDREQTPGPGADRAHGVPATADAAGPETTDAAGPSEQVADDPATPGVGDEAPARPTAAHGRACAACGSAPSAARPSMVVIAQAASLTTDGFTGAATAHLLWNTTRPPVELTAAAVQRLACDATIRTVIVDGAQPLGVTAAHPKVSATLRAALIARDGGCRFPACHEPVDACDNHHIVPVLTGGPTTLDNLLLLCRNHHHAVHDSGWTVTLDSDVTAIFQRRGMTLVSVARHDQRLEPGDPPPRGRPARRARSISRDDHGARGEPVMTGRFEHPRRSGPPLPF